MPKPLGLEEQKFLANNFHHSDMSEKTANQLIRNLSKGIYKRTMNELIISFFEDLSEYKSNFIYDGSNILDDEGSLLQSGNIRIYVETMYKGKPVRGMYYVTVYKSVNLEKASVVAEDFRYMDGTRIDDGNITIAKELLYTGNETYEQVKNSITGLLSDTDTQVLMPNEYESWLEQWYIN